MAWNDYQTLLSLDQYAQIMGVDPYEFNQLQSPRSRQAGCDSVWYQYSWQEDFLSREELGLAIHDAEHMLSEVLNYWPGPKYIFDEPVDYPQNYEPLAWGFGGTPDGNWKAVRLRWNRFIGGGQRNRTDIATANVSLSDPDSDSVSDRFTVTQAVPAELTDPDEIGIYFIAADRFNEPASEKWRIRPVNVTISGGNATITGHVSQLVKPALQTIGNPEILPIEVATFVSQVEVKRVFRDDTATDSNPNQGVAIWDVPPSDSSTPAIQIKPVSFGSRLNSRGMPYATFGEHCTWPYIWEPNRLQAHYVCGIPLERGTGKIPSQYARLIAYLATSLLPSEKCGCERSNRIIHYWRARVDEGDDGRNFTLEEINFNPFGEPTRGALTVWKQVSRLLSDQEIVSL